MRDYLNANEKAQFMVIHSILQTMEGIRNDGKDGPKIQTMLEEWSKRSNMTKEEHRSLKTAGTHLRKFITSVYERLSPKERETMKKRLMKFEFKLIDDFTLKQVFRDIEDRMQHTVMPRQQFYDWTKHMMCVTCNGCTKDWNTCELHTIFEDNFIPESSWNLPNCKFAYRLETETANDQITDNSQEIAVLKEKSGIPTKIEFNGQTYALVPDDYINGNKSKLAEG